MTEPHPSPVDVRGLRKAYAGKEAVCGVSFHVDPGEIFGLLGPNGAGKTSTVECLVGLRAPDAGEIRLCGLDARAQPAEVKQRLGVALQSTALPDRLTPREALRLFGSFYRKAEAPDPLLERFGLAAKADEPFDTLSGGQRQRLALALAFVNDPQVVFLDEPTTGLDPQSRRDLHGLITAMKRGGCTVVLTTHHLEEAEALCDRVAIIDRGRIVACGTPRELVAAARGRQSGILRTSGPLEASRVAALPGVAAARGGEGAITFETDQTAETLAALGQLLAAERLDVLELQVRRATLEEVFLQLTKEGGP